MGHDLVSSELAEDDLNKGVAVLKEPTIEEVVVTDQTVEETIVKELMAEAPIVRQ